MQLGQGQFLRLVSLRRRTVWARLRTHLSGCTPGCLGANYSAYLAARAREWAGAYSDHYARGARDKWRQASNDSESVSMTEENDLIPPKMLIVLEYLPSCNMNFRTAAVKAGYSASYARKIVGKFATDPILQKALHERMKRLLNEAGESDRIIVERILQRQHFDQHRISGSYLTGRSPFAVQI